MNRHRPYHPTNPRLGISPACATVPGDRAVAPAGADDGREDASFYRAFDPTGVILYINGKEKAQMGIRMSKCY